MDGTVVRYVPWKAIKGTTEASNANNIFFERVDPRLKNYGRRFARSDLLQISV